MFWSPWIKGNWSKQNQTKTSKHGHRALYAFAFSKSQLALSEFRPVLQTTTTPATLFLVPSSSISLPKTPRFCIHSFFNLLQTLCFLLFTPFQIKWNKMRHHNWIRDFTICFCFSLMMFFWLFGWIGRLKFSTPDICFFDFGFIIILKGGKMVAKIVAASISFLGYPSWKSSVFLRFCMHNLLFYSGHTNKIGFFYMRWIIQSKKKQGEKWYFLGSQFSYE